VSLDHYRGAAYAFRELMKAADRDVKLGGEIKAARRTRKIRGIWSVAPAQKGFRVVVSDRRKRA